ncbi:MAG: metal-dependent hydrolase [Proteobacteria bacterium]|nr:metal-dependent hydrolase [Pseudomonadota bacterium]
MGDSPEFIKLLYYPLMDPFSQAVVGATFASTSADKTSIRPIILAGALAGMAADLDVLINSATDPLLFLEYHRQFTHSLLFVPIGAALVALALWPFFKRRLTSKQLFIACFLGYLSHGLLDACTTYGTQLLWPITDHRFAWHLISIIDPLFTLPLAVALVWAMIALKPFAAQRLALFWMLVYLSLGEIQRQRAVDAGYELAESRGHMPTRLEAKPGFAQLILWKIVYEWDGHFYVDGVRTAFDINYYPGDRIRKIDAEWANRVLPPKSQIRRDFDRFRWFSNDYLALDTEQDNLVIDVRYSMNVRDIRPLWGVLFDLEAPQKHVQYLTFRSMDQQTLDTFWQMLAGHPEAHLPKPLIFNQPLNSRSP